MRNLVLLASLLIAAPALAFPAAGHMSHIRARGTGSGTAYTPVCPDGICNGSETCGTCEADCGACAPECGDDECNGDETCVTCEADCGACVAPTECSEDPDPYPLYTSWDRNCAPWHSQAGDWGPQVTLTAPTLPTITSTSNAATAAAFNTAAAVSGRRITVTADWTENVSIHADDLEVIVPAGRSIRAIEIGVYPHTAAWHRIRIAGSVDGLTHGGTVGQIRSDSATTDVIVDGVDVNSSGNYGAPTREAFLINATRVAILNVRAIAPSFCWEGTNYHVFVANTNMYCGAEQKTSATDPGWSFRNLGGPITIVDSHFESTRYVTVRAQSNNGAGELLYVGNSTIVERAEKGLFWFWDGVGNCPSCVGDGAIVEDSFLYGYAAGGACGGSAEIMMSGGNPSCVHSAYTKMNDNHFYSGATAWTQTTINANETTCDAAGKVADFGKDTSGAGNVFATWTANPSWDGPGDPRDVPMVGVTGVANGEDACPGFAF